MTPLFAIQDPNWGRPIFVPETVAFTEEGAWEKYEKSNLSIYATLGRKVCEGQGFKAVSVKIVESSDNSKEAKP